MEAGKLLEKLLPECFFGDLDKKQIIENWQCSAASETPLLITKVVCANPNECANFNETAFLDVRAKTYPADHVYYGYPYFNVCKNIFIELAKVKGNWSALEMAQRDAVVCLGNYFEKFDEEHRSCLEKMFTSDSSAVEIQAVLAYHLFGPLVSDGFLTLDQNCQYSGKDNESCPFCERSDEEKVKIGNTMFGNSSAWHGRAHIVINQRAQNNQVVKIPIVVCEEKQEFVDEDDSSAGNHSSEQYCLEHDSKCKKARLNDQPHQNVRAYPSNQSIAYNKFSRSGLVKMKQHPIVTDKCLILSKTNRKAINQVLSQTVVNGFLVCQDYPNLEENFIPCFLASNKRIAVNMYNSKHDVLLSQGSFSNILNENCGSVSCSLAKDTIFIVWLALNLNLFPPVLPFEVENGNLCESGFVRLLDKSYEHIYKHDLSSGCNPGTLRETCTSTKMDRKCLLQSVENAANQIM